MAYGQTGSGKTHSMFGSPGKKSPGDDEGASPHQSLPRHANHLPNPPNCCSGYAAARPGRATPQLPEGAGIIPRAIADIFTMARRREAAQLPPVAIYCSFVQIYNEQVRYICSRVSVYKVL